MSITPEEAVDFAFERFHKVSDELLDKVTETFPGRANRTNVFAIMSMIGGLFLDHSVCGTCNSKADALEMLEQLFAVVRERVNEDFDDLHATKPWRIHQ